MERKEFLQSILALTAMGTLSSFKNFTDALPSQGKKMPVLFTSHGNPMDIPVSRSERAFWQKLYDLGITLQKSHEVKAALVVSAHWCTKGTFVNISPEQKQIYDYYGFPEEYYKVYYKAKGSPDIAREVKKIVPSVSETTDWGLDHGAWPMLMHLFPDANIPVFQLSIDYYAKPEYHYELGKQLKSLRNKGVLIIGSGALIHNLQLAGQKMRKNDMTLYGWEAEYDAWLKQQINARNFANLINYQNSHKLGKLAAPTPDHYVPLLYSLGLTDSSDEIKYFYEAEPTIPAFSERSFIIG
ncbi:MAG: dioxygenase [Balneola sp.]|jgi:4,5-DOPA dioxygenase extradiol|uniref:Aromatic ring-opening dioxygenase, catalytic subunit, LigB family n=1 Tax=Cyclobacterium lianum TaxID=388280 RepID=A0A1M7QVF2_9BACT|nr:MULTISPECIES: class III extradiol ring-cleavage dioxygenase [Bacteroidota]MAC04769.1 dioxygenase [Balneola sp.]MAC05642.1 dioxygenase [Balneola sp.]MAO77602.1 dioxygenase [Balneola sp.]MBF64799.1 dioxygenase [Balneola sp.]MBO6621377.1 dioxygenase [Balneola sp.]|tara:strand:- start:2272 stop:3165 length:894 start_codon:yes stop_codon:yes gene_type:complete